MGEKREAHPRESTGGKGAYTMVRGEVGVCGVASGTGTGMT